VAWLLVGLCLTPALIRLPGYLFGYGLGGLEGWVAEWLTQPLRGAEALLQPASDADRNGRLAWVAVQTILLVPLLPPSGPNIGPAAGCGRIPAVPTAPPGGAGPGN